MELREMVLIRISVQNGKIEHEIIVIPLESSIHCKVHNVIDHIKDPMDLEPL